ncbi:dihydrolipoamide acetyltransferase component of pyruvate dehydrogenase complex [Desulfoluna limicola]|uniref:Dihydrolipoamide acetyltransferase component of pyruvate dehydrogenase complex n=1 Tax=Desulfoluna limicola TaxID=2810562 RepID=A0ABM7PDN6_9BACT|nr:dihydrolipoamide acetyltransferase family protein [Desulfoluna limicola]BCS95750.1 dihydrolipoamide acetyltransferase component of pyruvate dehydrogenase complex [Desulfoluna limicola]
MAIPINMPKLGLSMKTGTISKWLKNEGDSIKKGELLVEIMTEKITNKVESKAEGVLLKIVASKDEIRPVGELICVIGEEGEDISGILAEAEARTSKTVAGKPSKGATKKSASTPLSDEERRKIKISPVARKLAEGNGLDYTLIAGTGPDGRITKEDVEIAITQGEGMASGMPDDRPVQQVIPYEGMRQAIGENMARSSSSNARVTLHVSVDMTGVLALRKKLNAGAKEKDKISVTAILTKAVARALELNPCLNASLTGDEIRIWQDIHIGMAVALPEGLMVPVLRNPCQKRLSEVNTEISDLAKRARKNKLDVDEMTGATFTVTNLGGYGSVDFFTPIINPPEVAILGIGRTTEKPAVVDGQVVARPLMGLSLVFDHRVVDGAPAAEWLALLIGLIEKPESMFV